MELTNQEKLIYNKHLVISRQCRGKAGKFRKDFSDFDESKVIWLKRLSIFFSKYPDVDMDAYFTAPYSIYPDSEYFDLQYFASPRGIKAYTLFKQTERIKSPDEQLPQIKESLSFITKFCLTESIPFSEYFHTSTGTAPIWCKHIKEGKINPYSIIASSVVADSIFGMPLEEKEFFLGKFGTDFAQHKTAYIKSEVVREFLPAAYKKVEEFINKHLKNTK